MEYLTWILQIVFHYTLIILCTRSEIPRTVLPMKTNFSCLDRTPGFYADTDASCKIYHTCDEYGNKFTYHCPEETAFRQDALICDHAHLVHCQGYTLLKAEEVIEKRQSSSTSHIKVSTDDINNLFLYPLSPVTQQPTKTNNKVQHGFAFSSNVFLKSFNETGVTKSETMQSFHSLLNPFNSLTYIPFNHFKNTRTHYISLLNRNQQSELRKDGNPSIQNQSFNNNIKLNKEEKTNETNYIHQNTNNTSYNYLKLSSGTFLGNFQNQENNISNYQTINSFRDSLKPSFMNHRNYPYLETLKSIQKSTKTSSITINTTVLNTSLTTTEVPAYALTLSLKPLVPSELEYDPYYPRFPTSTEVYYTPSLDNKELMHDNIRTKTSWSSSHLQLPSVLPDLNFLEDVVDRRKLFYIPRIKSN